jgi:hypothetical protein
MSNGHDYDGGNPAFYCVQLGSTVLVCDRPWIVRVAPSQPSRAGACEAHVTIAPRRSSTLNRTTDTEPHHRHRTAPLTLTATTMEAARTQRQVSVRAQAQRGEDGVEFANA